MGGEIRRSAQAAMGEPVTALASAAGYRIWAGSYDQEPNPVLALETRLLRPRLEIRDRMRVLDLATGTGRWLDYVLRMGADAFGIDLSGEMLEQAARKGMAGRLVKGTLTALPFADGFAEVAICSFAAGYIADTESVFREIVRTSRRVIVSDLHPEAVRAGWVRGFRSGDVRYEVKNHPHSIHETDACAGSVGLELKWRLEASFGEAERGIFERAGKGARFDVLRALPAILISCWERV